MAEKMKPSGIAWIGDVPQEWNIKRVKYLASLKGRIGWQGLTSDEYIDEGPYLITGIDFQNGGIDWNNCVHISEERWAEAPEIHIQNGDLLITKDGTVGKVAIVSGLEGKASLNSGVLLIRTEPNFDKRFLFWVLQSEEFWTWFRLKNAGNSTIIHLYQGDFAEFSYTFPNVTEQCAIADFLDAQCAKIDSIIADIEKQIETLQKYKKSLITEAVTKGLDRSVPMKDIEVACIGFVPANWKYKKLGYMAEVTKLAGFEFTDYFEYVDEGVIAIRGLNLKNFDISLADIQHIPEKTSDMLPRSQVHYNDVLISYAGTVGSIGLITDIDRRYHLAPNVGKVTIRSELIPRYLAYYLISYAGQEHIDQLKNKNAQESISMENIRRIKVLVPPQVEQQTICDYLDKKTGEIDDLISGQQKKLELIQAHKKSLIYEYVTGKKRVTEVN